MGIDLTCILCLALAMEIVAGLLFLVVGCHLGRATWRWVESHAVSHGTTRKQHFVKNKVRFSH
jgi:hypothetical protein